MRRVLLAAAFSLFSTAAVAQQRVEDAAHASGDVGSFSLCVRNDSAGTTFTGANGDYSPFACDSAGRIWTVPQGGIDIGDVTINNGSGAAAVNIQDGGNSITVDGPLTDAQLRATHVPVSITDGTNTVATIATGPSLNVNLRTINGATPSTNTGTVGAGVQRVTLATDVALPAGTNNIGDVDVLTVPAPLSTTGGGTEATALRVTVANDSTGLLSVDDNGGALTVDNAGTFATQPSQATAANLNAEVQGDAAHDAAVSGNPVLTGGEARTSNGTAVANGDAVRAQFDVVGRQVVSPYTLYDNVVRGCGNATGTGDTAVIAAAGAGVRNYITTITIVNTSATATYVSVKDGTTVLLEIPAPANNGGAVVPLPVPIRTTANTAFNFASAAAVTTMRVCAAGFTAP